MNDMTNLQALVLSETELCEVLQNSLYPGAKPESIKLVIGYCKASGLDPMQKPVHIVPMDVSTGMKDAKGWDIKQKRDVVMPGIGLYRVQAARTGEHAGTSEPEFGKSATLKLGDVEITVPEWCKVVVRRVVRGHVVDFTAKEFWLENYARKGRDPAPNSMWQKRPYAQLAKCAEAQALRKGFPDAVGSASTADEMEGKSFEDIDTVTGEIMRPAISAPQAKSGQPEKPDAPESKPLASAGQIAMITKKLTGLAAIEQKEFKAVAEECLEAFKIDKWEGISVETGNAILKWINERS